MLNVNEIDAAVPFFFSWFTVIIRNSKKSQKDGNHRDRDFYQMLWFSQNAMILHFLQEFFIFIQHKLKFIVCF